MAPKLLLARERGTDLYFRVLLDAAKEDVVLQPAQLEVTDEEGNVVQSAVQERRGVDESYVREYQWSAIPPKGQSKADYVAAIKREIRLLAQAEAARMAPPEGTVLAGEGQAL